MLRRPTDYSQSAEWQNALAAMARAEAPRPQGCRCTAPASVVVDSMRGTRLVREQRDALRRARREQQCKP
jgi:hypothetical protein